jgi:subtilisin family serine protease
MRNRNLRIGLVVAAAVGCVVAMASAVPAAAEGRVLGAGGAAAVQNSYIVVLNDARSPRSASTRTAGDLAGRYGGQVRATWSHALNGFAVTMDAGAASRLAADPRVSYVEQDRLVSVADTQLSPPSWGLDRVDQRNLPLSGSYSYATTASNVHAYVIDTGIRTTHTTFGGRASWGFDAVDSTYTDCNGHGTHVAGTIGGAQYGVAKGVALVAVRVLNCGGTGTSAQVISGVDWVTGHAVLPAVANMSLSIPGPGSVPAIDTAVQNSIQSGVTYAVAAGNDTAKDACGGSPSKVPAAITVGATQSNDTRSGFSNIGSCVDLFAPGSGITSSWNTNDTATKVEDGTSMATPHVAGAAALFLSANPAAAPAAVQAALVGQSTGCVVGSAGAGSPNRLLYSVTTGMSVLNPCTRTYAEFDQVSLQMFASGGTGSHTWSMTGICCQISINATTGLISGRAQPGFFTVTVTARDTAGSTASATFSISISKECRTCLTVH